MFTRNPDDPDVDECKRSLGAGIPEAIYRRCGGGNEDGGDEDGGSEDGDDDSSSSSDDGTNSDPNNQVATNDPTTRAECILFIAIYGALPAIGCDMLKGDFEPTTPPTAPPSSPPSSPPPSAPPPPPPPTPPALKGDGGTRGRMTPKRVARLEGTEVPSRRQALEQPDLQDCGWVEVGDDDRVEKCGVGQTI